MKPEGGEDERSRREREKKTHMCGDKGNVFICSCFIFVFIQLLN